MRWWMLVPLGLAACTRPNPGFSTSGLDASSSGGSTGVGASSTDPDTSVPTGGSQSDGGSGPLTTDGVTTDVSTTDPVASTTGGTSSTATTDASTDASTGCVTCECSPGESAPCYTGQGGTNGVGVCVGGTKTCDAMGQFGPCVDEVTPADKEVCGDGLDNQCDATDIDRCEALAEGCPDHPALVACYTFPEAAGALIDGSGYKRDGTLTGVGDTPSLMNFANAGDFKGTSYADVPELPAFSPEKLTLSLLVYPTTSGGTLLDKDNQYALTTSGGFVNCLIVNKFGVTVPAGAFLPLNKWSHVACTYDGAAIRVRVHTSGMNATPPTPILHAGPLAPASGSGLTLGADNPGHDKFFFKGRLDQVLVFHDVLTDDAICMLDPFCG